MVPEWVLAAPPRMADGFESVPLFSVAVTVVEEIVAASGVRIGAKSTVRKICSLGSLGVKVVEAAMMVSFD